MNQIDLAGKVAVITGSTKGIGKSIAEELGRAGAKVMISSRKADACEATRAELAGMGLAVLAQPCNVGRKEEVAALVAATEKAWGKVDIMVCNAAVNPYYGPLGGLSDETFDKVMNSNVKSNLWLANLVIPGMAARGGGSVIMVGSIAGLKANTIIGAYGISKAADHMLVKNLAAEWGPKNVRVNAIAPGLVKTDMARALWEPNEHSLARHVPMARLGEPEDLELALDGARHLRLAGQKEPGSVGREAGQLDVAKLRLGRRGRQRIHPPAGGRTLAVGRLVGVEDPQLVPAR